MWRGNHISTLAPVYDHTPIYKVGYTPTQIFDKFPMTDEAPVLRALSVKYVMSSYPVVRSDLELERRFGALYVYRHSNYHPDPFTVLGGGQGELLELTAERIRIRLAGTGKQSRIKVHVANYPRWRASFDGEEVPIRTVPIYGAEYPILMEVPARNGVLTLDYVALPADVWGLVLSALGLPVFLALGWFGARNARVALVLAYCDTYRRRIAAGVVGLGAALAVALLVVAHLRSTPLPRTSVFRNLEFDATLGRTPCRRAHPLRYECGSEVVEASVVSGVWGVHLCMSSKLLPRAGPLLLRARARLGGFLRGEYDPSQEGNGSIQVRVDGKRLGYVRTRPSFLRRQFIQFDTRHLAGRTVDLEIELAGAALHCFDFEVLP
jgi:hypothetical protein